jgi:hypothetical protein
MGCERRAAVPVYSRYLHRRVTVSLVRGLPPWVQAGPASHLHCLQLFVRAGRQMITSFQFGLIDRRDPRIVYYLDVISTDRRTPVTLAQKLIAAASR